MKMNKIIIASFIILMGIQWVVPASMIWKNDNRIKTGTELKLKIKPIDPHDPFRGKYISLYFEEDKYDIVNVADWKEGQTIYVIFQKDSLGFAQIVHVEKNKPSETNLFVKAKLSYIDSYSEPKKMNIIYPFNRFYMEESLDWEAEQLALRFSDDKIDFYAQVFVKDGQAVISDVFVNHIPINEYLKTQ